LQLVGWKTGVTLMIRSRLPEAEEFCVACDGRLYAAFGRANAGIKT